MFDANIQTQIKNRYQEAIKQIAPQLSKRMVRDLDLAALSEAAKLTANSIAPLGLISRRWQRRCTITAWFSIPIAIGLLFLSIQGNRHDVFFTGSSLAISVMGFYATRSGRELMALNQLILNGRAAKGVNFPELAPEASPNGSPINKPLFDWTNVRSFVHIAVVGKSGSGKSFLTQWFIKQFGGDVRIYDSDAAPYEWQGLTVIGKAADYGAIATAMEADLEELQHRTEMRANGDESYGELIRVLEETPETLSAMNGLGFDVSYRWLKGLLRRGRKYKMRLILSSQGFSVRSLKIDGEGDLRDNLNVIRLGFVAQKYAALLSDKSILPLLSEQNRPALIDDDQVGNVPDL